MFVCHHHLELNQPLWQNHKNIKIKGLIKNPLIDRPNDKKNPMNLRKKNNFK